MDPQRPAADGEHRPDDSLTEALTNAVIAVTKDYVGRGPTRGRAFLRDDIVVVILGETLTKAERTLVSDGKAERVLSVRQEFQRAMRDPLVQEVERLTGRSVIAFMSDNHIDPELACEVFVLEPARKPTGSSRPPASGERTSGPRGRVAGRPGGGKKARGA